MESADILGVRVDNVTLNEAIEQVAEFLREDRCHQVATVNPEFIIAARRVPEFAQVLAACDLNVPDGANLVRAAGFIGQPLRERVGGRDVVLRLAERGASEGWKFYLLGGRENVAEISARKLCALFPNLQVVETFEGSPDKRFDEEMVARVNASGAGILLVAYGAPKQELWIGRNRGRLLPRVAIGVGGAFDSIAGRVPIAPTWMQRAGLEWLFRLVIEPWRWRRQIALVEFLGLILIERLGSKERQVSRVERKSN